MESSTIRRRALIGALSALLLVGVLATSAGAASRHRWTSVPGWYQYDPVTWTRGWPASPKLVHQNDRWVSSHPNAPRFARNAWHHTLRLRWRDGHLHRGIRSDAGQATWYNQTGTIGACGVPLRGLYAASRTLPCGSLVSVRHGSRYVFVHVIDRGPFGSASRILDLSPDAFAQLAPLGAGVIDIHLVQLSPATKYRL